MPDYDEEIGWLDKYLEQQELIEKKGLPLEIRGPVLKTWSPEKPTLEILLSAIEILKEEHPVTVRHIFYCLVGQGILSKEEKEYKSKLIYIMKRARLSGLVPMDWIIDSSRRVLEVSLYDSVKEFLTEKIKYYYKNTWRNQRTFVLVWVEKEALANPLWEAVNYYNIPVFPGKGYDSWAHFLKAVKKIREMEDREIVVLYLGDHDPSGMDIPSDLENRCNLMNLNVRFKRIAITDDQIEKHNIPKLPLRKNPEKRKYNDPRAEKYVEKYGPWFVELDALKPSIMKRIVKEEVEDLLDLEAFAEDLETEAMEKDFLRRYMLDIDECFELYEEDNIFD